MLLDSKPVARPKSARYERPGGSRPQFSRKYLTRWIGLGVSVVLVLGSAVTGWSVGTSVFQGSGDPLSAKLAEWGRDHGLGALVTGIEAIQYKLHPPQKGGKPNSSQLALLQGAGGSSKPTKANPDVVLQAPIAPLVTPALPGEGFYKALVTHNGLPVIQVAYLRPDAVHTSYLAAVVWMSQKHTRLELHPGYSDPGNTSLFGQPDYIPNVASNGVIASFNAGFKIKDSRGGFYLNGHTAGVMTAGAASVVTYSDGHTDIGAWGTEVSMGSNVVSVRQNLRLLIDNGRLSPDLNGDVQTTWGATLGGAYDVWRTGVGVTAKGDLVYVIGNALSVRSLANLLLQAGAVRAMQLDINYLWASYMWYSTTSVGTLMPHKVVDFVRPAARYLSPTSRDFFAVYYR